MIEVIGSGSAGPRKRYEPPRPRSDHDNGYFR